MWPAFRHTLEKMGKLLKNRTSYPRSFSFRLDIFDILFLLILLYMVVLRINYIEPSPGSSDLYMDYLIAHHIVEYQEPLLTGPWNNMVGPLMAPYYYYLLSFFLLIKDDVMMLQLANIFLQAFTIILLYLIVKNAFSPGTALIVSLLFVSSAVSFFQSFTMWHPHMMQPFLYLSYFLLLLSYLKRKYHFLLLSGTLLVFAGTLHQAAFGVLPVFLIVAFLILRKWGRPISHYVLTVATVIFSFFLLYIPTLIHLRASNFDSSAVLLQRFIQTPSDFFPNIAQNISLLTNLLSPHIGNTAFAPSTILNSLGIGLLFILIVIALIYFTDPRVNPTKKTYTGIILGTILFFLISASFLDVQEKRYFTPIFGLSFIFIAVLINSLSSKNLILKVGKFIMIILLIIVVSYNIHYLKLVKGGLYKSGVMDPAIFSVIRDLREIQQTEKTKDLHFFQFREFEDPYSSWAGAPYFWITLEKKLNTKFTELVNSKGHGFRSINDDLYIFLICNPYLVNNKNDGAEKCVATFSAKYPNYSILKETYSGPRYTIYLTRRGI